jgi:hypothetical protein
MEDGMSKPKLAAIGDNNPPEPINEAYEAARVQIEDLYSEMLLWLDGEPITNQAQANDVAELIDRMLKATKAAETAKGVEKRPHLDANTAIEARYKPLVTKGEQAVKVAKAAQAKYLKMLQDEQRKVADEAAKRARDEADAAAKAAREAAQSGNLAQAEEAEALIEQAQASAAEAKMLDGLKAQAKGDGAARSIGLRTVWTVKEVTDPIALMRHYWPQPHRQAEIAAFMFDMARKDVRGGARAIPGVLIVEDQIV